MLRLWVWKEHLRQNLNPYEKGGTLDRMIGRPFIPRQESPLTGGFWV